jgi:hypothetical protein
MLFPKHRIDKLTSSMPRATIIKWWLAILQSLISAYLFGGK